MVEGHGKRSILRRLVAASMAFGALMGVVFPVYAHFFVVWKPGMFVWFALGALVAGLTVGAVNYILVRTILLSKLRQISQISAAISEGDLTRTCTIQSNDLIGTIVGSSNGMIANLRTLLSRIVSLGGKIRRGSRTVEDLAERIRREHARQREAVDTITAAAQTLADSGQEIAVATTGASERAHQASVLASRGGEAVRDSVTAIREIGGFVTGAATSVRELGERSDAVVGVTQVINDISDQTNLLALNAAIEAARAGEHGRGFAVVADEVRKLAERTNRATAEIEKIVADMQTGTRGVLADMESGVGRTKACVQQAEGAGAMLRDIVDGVQTVSSMIAEIEHSTVAQNQAVSSIRGEILEVAGIVEGLSGDTEAAARVGTDLAAEAVDLERAVANFKT